MIVFASLALSIHPNSSHDQQPKYYFYPTPGGSEQNVQPDPENGSE